MKANPEYLVLSVQHPPAGAAAYAAPGHFASSGSPAALHDVQFYEEVAKELPNSPVLHSLLFSHRHVVNPDPPADAAIEEIEKRVSHWRRGEIQKANDIRVAMENLAKAEREEQQRDLMRRDLEHERVVRRMEEQISNLEMRMEAQLIQHQEPHHLPEEWHGLQSRWEERTRAAQDACHVIQRSDSERQGYHMEMEKAAHQSKAQINETLERCLLLSEEEGEYVRLKMEFLNAEVRVRLHDDFVESFVFLVAEENSARSSIIELFSDEHRKVRRHWEQGHALNRLLHHTEANEMGLRFNIQREESHELNEMCALMGVRVPIVMLSNQ